MTPAAGPLISRAARLLAARRRTGGRPWARTTRWSAAGREDKGHAGLFVRPAGQVRGRDGRPAWGTDVLPAGKRRRPGNERRAGEGPGELARGAPRRTA